jgi:hypothetical protein
MKANNSEIRTQSVVIEKDSIKSEVIKLFRCGLILNNRFSTDGDLKNELQITPGFSFISFIDFKECVSFDKNENEVVMSLPQDLRMDIDPDDDMDLSDNIGVFEIKFELFKFVSERGAEIPSGYDAYKLIINRLRMSEKINVKQAKYLTSLIRKLISNHGTKLYIDVEGSEDSDITSETHSVDTEQELALSNGLDNLPIVSSNQPKVRANRPYNNESIVDRRARNRKLSDKRQSQPIKADQPEKIIVREIESEATLLEKVKSSAAIALMIGVVLGQVYVSLRVTESLINAYDLEQFFLTFILIELSQIAPPMAMAWLHHVSEEANNPSDDQWEEMKRFALRETKYALIASLIVNIPIYLLTTGKNFLNYREQQAIEAAISSGLTPEEQDAALAIKVRNIILLLIGLPTFGLSLRSVIKFKIKNFSARRNT